MHAAQRQAYDDARLLAAQHAVWSQAAVNRGAGSMLGAKADWLGVWDFVPDLEPGFHRKRRAEERRKRNIDRWLAAAKSMGSA